MQVGAMSSGSVSLWGTFAELTLQVQEKLKGFFAQGKPLLPDH